MKRILIFLTLALMLLPCIACAEELVADVPEAVEIETEAEAEEDTPVIPGEPLTWAYLATIAGATAATLLIVQFLKVPLDKIWKIPTRAFVYFVALVLLLAGTYFTAGLTVETACLTAVNAVIVALTAYGSYEVTFHKWEKY